MAHLKHVAEGREEEEGIVAATVVVAVTGPVAAVGAARSSVKGTFEENSASSPLKAKGAPGSGKRERERESERESVCERVRTRERERAQERERARERSLE